ncbi:MAG: AAA family ATPase [Chloroflexi bacterium]|nr:AAA family ATPase [Chloroflexota bacterium]
MRITKISVKGLFGMFDHEIPLNQESRITIIHGPNGVGKTVFFRLIHALFTCDYDYVIDGVPFERIRIEFEADAFIIVEKRCQNNTRGYESCHALDFIFDDGNETQSEFSLRRPEYYEGSQTEQIREFYLDGLGIIDDLFERKGTGKFDLWRKDDWQFTSEQLVDMVPGIHDSIYSEVPEWTTIRREVKTGFIMADRTQVLNTSGWIDDGYDISKSRERGGLGLGYAISTISESIKGVARGESIVTDRDRVQASLAHLDSDFKDPVVAAYFESKEWRKDLARYIAKRRSFIPTYREQMLLEEIINERFLFKHFEIDAKLGLRFVGANGKNVHCDHLSSGEQQLLILYYQLLFEIKRNTLVMIDEPELSMNVVWQRNFLKDLQRIIELRKFDVLIATHSPEVIFDKWDWTVALGEKADD